MMEEEGLAGGCGGSGRCDVSDDRTNAVQDDESACWRQSQTEFLYAMKEDIGDWLGALYGVVIGADEFFEQLETGILLCRHANDLLGRRSKDGHATDDLSKWCIIFNQQNMLWAEQELLLVFPAYLKLPFVSLFNRFLRNIIQY